MYEMDMRQQPVQARMAGAGSRADRRPLDPPPIIRLRIRQPKVDRRGRDCSSTAAAAATMPTGALVSAKSPLGARSRESSRNRPGKDMNKNSQGDGDNVDDAADGNDEAVTYTSPSMTHTLFCFASLVGADHDKELYQLSGSRSMHVTGSVVSSLFHLKDQSCFVFPDLSVRTEGKFRFKMSLFEIMEDGVRYCTSIFTDPFQVYSSKRFPGMTKSTELSKAFAEQGLRLRIRRPGVTERDERDERDVRDERDEREEEDDAEDGDTNRNRMLQTSRPLSVQYPVHHEQFGQRAGGYRHSLPHSAPSRITPSPTNEVRRRHSSHSSWPSPDDSSTRYDGHSVPYHSRTVFCAAPPIFHRPIAYPNGTPTPSSTSARGHSPFAHRPGYATSEQAYGTNRAALPPQAHPSAHVQAATAYPPPYTGSPYPFGRARPAPTPLYVPNPNDGYASRPQQLPPLPPPPQQQVYPRLAPAMPYDRSDRIIGSPPLASVTLPPLREHRSLMQIRESSGAGPSSSLPPLSVRHASWSSVPPKISRDSPLTGDIRSHKMRKIEGNSAGGGGEPPRPIKTERRDSDPDQMQMDHHRTHLPQLPPIKSNNHLSRLLGTTAKNPKAVDSDEPLFV
ncbi:BQ2448_6684 [Microbotryum intermedium]|uniref:BQ2448_6684 protein n=1 Tax=Microbotryum intermedium TaxID=269621 RepID=A0A238FKD8_9BASI|nr:BQ2448_6684 [Microbotryum intermedium]